MCQVNFSGHFHVNSQDLASPLHVGVEFNGLKANFAPTPGTLPLRSSPKVAIPATVLYLVPARFTAK